MEMQPDMCVPCGEGFVNIRVGALIAVHENYFYGDSPSKQGKQIYEIAFYFIMDVPDGFEPVSYAVTEGDVSENLVWVAPDTEKKIYPDFFREEVPNPSKSVRVVMSDDGVTEIG